jgi:O-antigen/teichoic acid export membrane protein
LSSIKKLAGETLWYGGSTIVARLLNTLLTPYLTYNMTHKADYGKIGLIYAFIPILNIIFTYGFETAYFRFSSQKEKNNNLYSTAAISLFASTVLFALVLWFNKSIIGVSIGLQDFPDIVKTVILIIAIDTFCAIPFAKLRQDNRPIKYALAKIVGIFANIFFTLFFIGYCPKHTDNSIVQLVYSPSVNEVTYVMLANLIQSLVTLCFLYKEVFTIKLKFDFTLWKEMMRYAWPLILVGMGGVINDTMNRIMLRWWLPGSAAANEEAVGVFNACAKLAILITLFVQAFKMAGEPFFFKQAELGAPQKMYAKVMKLFVIVLCFAFLSVALYMPIWQYFVGPKYREGLGIVPIMLMANIFLGIYYNLTVWYKLTNKNLYGAWITLVGSLFSVAINYMFIPKFGLMACAWSTLITYGVMMALSYFYGQKYYPVPYNTKKILWYLGIVSGLFLIQKAIALALPHSIVTIITGVLLTAAFAWFIALVERTELAKLPFIGKYFAKNN